MPKYRYLPLAATLATLTALACVTINVYFPEAAVKDLSEQIEDAVLREAAKEPRQESAPATEDGQSDAGTLAEGHLSQLRSAVEIALGTALHVLGPAPAYAQQPQDDVAAPEITNPAIRQIIQSRSTRVRQLNRYKAAGAVGENNSALVEVRDLNALPLQERAAVQKLVREENADRERMFQEVAAATGTDLSQLPRVRETYAVTLREKARRGDWIQMPEGNWRQKE